jgi:integrase/recombinase XerD
MNEGIQLYDPQGRRLYLTAAERDAFLYAATQADRPIRTLCNVLYYTGCRISEALVLTPRRIDINDQTIIFETLKKRRRGVYRAVPVPQALIDTIDLAHGLREAQKRHNRDMLDALLWSFARNTAWRQVTAVMRAAGIPDGPHRCPKGVRHGFAIHALSKGVPLPMVSKWMGHAKMETTAIYCNAVGEEQQSIAARMWT